MLRRWHVILFAAALAVFAAALAPASLLAGWLGRGASLEGASGLLWRGQAKALRLGAMEARDLRWRLSARALLGGQVRLALESDGGNLSGVGELRLGPGSRRAVTAQRLALRGAPLIPGVALGGETVIENLALQFREGRCAAAAGVVRSDVLSRGAQGLGWRGPALAGSVVCDGPEAVIAAAGVEAGEDVGVAMRLQPGRPGRWRIEVASATPTTLAALAAAGFQVDAAAGVARHEREIPWRAP